MVSGQGSVKEKKGRGQLAKRQTVTKIKSYQDLDVWKKAMDLVMECYKAVNKFPKTEVYGLSSQLQRAAVSVPANIAEGQGRWHTKEFINHLSIAYGSLAELETHLQIAERLQYIDKSQLNHFMNMTGEIGRMINGLGRALESNNGK